MGKIIPYRGEIQYESKKAPEEEGEEASSEEGAEEEEAQEERKIKTCPACKITNLLGDYRKIVLRTQNHTQDPEGNMIPLYVLGYVCPLCGNVVVNWQ